MEKAGTFETIGSLAKRLRLELSPEDMACLASRHDFGEKELSAIESVLSYIAETRHESAVETLLLRSGLPKAEPKTFDNFDFGRLKGKDAEALRSLCGLANLHARKNIAFIGPGGIGKTHLAQAYGHECCRQGYRTYFIKASVLNARLEAAVKKGGTSRVVNGLVSPSCLIIDEIGRCVFSEQCTNLLFDIVDRRYEKEKPNTLIVTSNEPVINWHRFFTGKETLLCMLDRIFDKATVFMMKGESYRGRGCETFSVDVVPEVVKIK